MKQFFSIALFMSFIFSASAEWTFDDRIKIVPEYKGKSIFHHMDASGRTNMAISDNTIAVIWEDNHTGSPQAFVAFKTITDKKFSHPIQISTGTEAYEPSITTLGHGQFLMGWEQDGKVWMRSGTMNQLNPAQQASTKEARQISLTKVSNNKAIAAWAQQAGHFTQIVTAEISLNNTSMGIKPAKTVEAKSAKHKQSYPVIASTNNNITIVWEDRRRGHTMLLQSNKQNEASFTPAKVLNEIVKKSPKYGRGSGVTRVALARCDEKEILATWMDKRNRHTGYDIYAAQSSDEGQHFSANESVQDSFGENIAQWNPAVACDAKGNKLIAWYDDRDESMDILLTWKTSDGWSEDMLVDPASGEGEQTSASITLDKYGILHMVWIDQVTSGAPTSLYYAMARNQK